MRLDIICDMDYKKVDCRVNEHIICAFFYDPGKKAYNWLWPVCHDRNTPHYQEVQEIHNLAKVLLHAAIKDKSIEFDFSDPVALTKEDNGMTILHANCNLMFIPDDLIGGLDTVSQLLDTMGVGSISALLSDEDKEKTHYKIPHVVMMAPDSENYKVEIDPDTRRFIITANEQTDKLLFMFELDKETNEVKVGYSATLPEDTLFIDESLFFNRVLNTCFMDAKGSNRIIPTMNRLGLDIFDKDSIHGVFYAGRDNDTGHEKYDLYLSGRATKSYGNIEEGKMYVTRFKVR